MKYVVGGRGGAEGDCRCRGRRKGGQRWVEKRKGRVGGGRQSTDSDTTSRSETLRDPWFPTQGLMT